MISTYKPTIACQANRYARTTPSAAAGHRAWVHYRPAVQKGRSAAPEVANPPSDSKASASPQTDRQGSSQNPISSAHSRSSSTSSPTSSNSSFQWLSHWYPVHVLESIDPSRPHAVELLGKQLVLWRAGSAAAAAGSAGPATSSSNRPRWQCFENTCPHRLAPLSEGRIAPDGTLQCSYHGWRFAEDGSCVEIPQALDSKSKQTACASRRSCAVAYPTVEAYGLIWVWPSAGPAAAKEAASTPIPVCRAVAAFPEDSLKWFRRELPFSWDIGVENLTDPAHVMVAHHRLTPSMHRDKAGPMPFNPLASPTAAAAAANDASEAAGQQQQQRPDFLHASKEPAGAYEYSSPIAAGARMAFTPPCSITCEYELAPGLACQSELLLVPRGPGRSLAITMVQMTNVPKVTAGGVLQALFTKPGQVPGMLKRLMGQPLWQQHLGANKLFDMDNVFLNMQDRLLSLKGRDSWAQAYYMPTPSDSAVIAARKWIAQAVNQALDPNDPSSPAAADAIFLSREAAAAPPLPQTVLNDRFSQHTKHCRICQQALQQLNARAAAARAAAVGFAAMAAGLFGVLACALLAPQTLQQVGGSLLGISSSGGTTAAAAAAAAAANSAGAYGFKVVAAITAALAAAAAAAAVLAGKLQQKVQEFVYVEFAHADND